MKIAFYAPMKSPHHPVPSGDRLMARQLLQALRGIAGEVRLASEFRAFARTPETVDLARVRDTAIAEADCLVASWRSEGWSPDIWFSYHPYYKAPDWLGPHVAERMHCPIVTAEASFAPRRAAGPWQAWHRENAATLLAARCHFTMTERDRAGLAAMPGMTAPLVSLPPFIDARPFALARGAAGSGRGAARLVTVAMMRPDVKRESYRALAASLARLTDLAWSLDIVGDGTARAEVEDAFFGLPAGRIRWHGQLDRDAVAEVLSAGDLFVWPGIQEAYGLAYLEAQAAGLPVVAFDNAGVPEVVNDGETGCLVEMGNISAYAAAVRALLEDRGSITRMGERARRFVTQERSLAKARETLASTLTGLIG